MFDLAYGEGITYGEIYKRAEWEWSTYNFEKADTAAHFESFTRYESEAKRLLSPASPKDKLILPAYDFVVKAAHQFNVLDARGAIGVTERQRYIGRVRALARAVAESYIAQREALGFPLLKGGQGTASAPDAKTANVHTGKEVTP
jgi:glycyl-tRNA synthetase alpha chain